MDASGAGRGRTCRTGVGWVGEGLGGGGGKIGGENKQGRGMSVRGT